MSQKQSSCCPLVGETRAAVQEVNNTTLNLETKNVLYLLCIGLNYNCGNEPLFSFEREPWSLLSKTSFPRPKNTDFVKEIGRRASLFNIAPVPRPASNSTRGQILDRLERNPVRDNALNSSQMKY